MIGVGPGVSPVFLFDLNEELGGDRPASAFLAMFYVPAHSLLKRRVPGHLVIPMPYLVYALRASCYRLFGNPLHSQITMISQDIC